MITLFCWSSRLTLLLRILYDVCPCAGQSIKQYSLTPCMCSHLVGMIGAPHLVGVIGAPHLIGVTNIAGTEGQAGVGDIASSSDSGQRLLSTPAASLGQKLAPPPLHFVDVARKELSSREDLHVAMGLPLPNSIEVLGLFFYVKC
jgi:hypothetical protein